MSGFKRAMINISQDEYQRLRDAEIKLRSLPEVPNPAYAQVSQQSEHALEENLAEMARRQAQFETAIAGMNDTVSDLENATVQRMLDYEASITAQAQAYAGSLWDHTNQIVNAQAEYFENTIAATHQQYQEALEKQSCQIRRMAGDRAMKQALAEEWLGTAEQLHLFIQQNYLHEMLSPGRVAKLERQLEQARYNLDHQLNEAAIVSGQQLYNAFSDLRIDLERLQAEWQLFRQTALETTRQMVIQTFDSQMVPAVDLDGNLLPIWVDVNYWSQGRLAEFYAELRQLQERLEDASLLPDRETLQRLLQTDLPLYFQKLCDIVLDARINALNSQLRINIADLVVRSLQDQGFALFASDYEGADMQSAYEAHLKNLEGSEVVVQVVPTGQAVGENELHLQSYDREERTEHELQQRWYEVSRSLASYGIAVGPYIREDGGEYITRQPTSPPNGPTRQQSRRPGSMNGYRTRSTGLPEG